MKLNELTAKQLSNMLRKKECSAVEIIQDVLDEIKSKDKDINSYITVLYESSINQAKKVDYKIAKKEYISLLAGIPVGIKDNICMKDTKTTCGSKMLSNFISPYDATVIERLKANDVVFSGKLNLDEFAMGSSGEYSYFGNTKNPLNLEYVPGGSSSGPAAAVAANEAIMSLGSDTGGSIRLPASFCGLVGLKPTYGSVSRYGLVALASSFDQIGPLAKNVDDTAMLYWAICGQDNKDATTVFIDHKIYENLDDININGLKIGIASDYFKVENIDKLVLDNINQSIKIFEDKGAIIKEIKLPKTDESLAAYYLILAAEASSNLARFDGVKYGYRTKNYTTLEEMYEKTRGEGFGQEVKRRIMLGTFILSAENINSIYAKGKLYQRKVILEMQQIFKDCDIIIIPSAPSTAFKINHTIDPIKMYLNDIFTVFVNLSGLPAISIPCGKGKNNLPIGIQFIGPHFSENLLLKIAKQHEKLTKN